MDINMLIELISSVGFPIAICIALILVVLKMMSTHKEEIGIMTKALENNTNAISTMSTKLDTIIMVSKGIGEHQNGST